MKTVARVGIWAMTACFLALIAICITAIFMTYVASRPITISADCEYDSLKELPTGYVFAGAHMLPDTAHCQIMVQGPMYAVMPLLNRG